ncbi:hypothetical protein GCM10023403_45030 [Pseudonocardia benzenivorans]|uniref:DUF7714 family protein n=1 Tax=Pseudonocardia benzenivorans TaxID=228005 RepID=UPI0033877B63
MTAADTRRIPLSRTASHDSPGAADPAGPGPAPDAGPAGTAARPTPAGGGFRGPNLIPNRYRGVSVTPVPDDVPLTEEALREYLTGRDAYRRTRFVVARRQGDFSQVALLHVEHDTQGELFSPVTAVTMLARPDECTFVVDESVDTGIPSDLVRCARERAPHARVAVIQGRYAHISFVLEPRMLHVGVREVVPPEPAKLLDQARRILAVSEQLPPMDLVGQLVDLADLAAQRPDEHYLLPCRGSGGEVPGATVSYLDEHPPKADWTLLGCERSRQIHHWFYGEDPPRVDFCPKRSLEAQPPADGGMVLTKCCLQEEHVESGPGWASVPWGASLEHIREALALLAAQEDPPWAPV